MRPSMADISPKGVTQLLVDCSGGNQAALDKLIPLVYEELRRLAHRYMRQERPGHTLQTTALVDEAYLRLVDQRRVRWQNRAHFFGVAPQLMRRILIDYARKHRQVTIEGVIAEFHFVNPHPFVDRRRGANYRL